MCEICDLKMNYPNYHSLQCFTLIIRIYLTQKQSQHLFYDSSSISPHIEMFISVDSGDFCFCFSLSFSLSWVTRFPCLDFLGLFFPHWGGFLFSPLNILHCPQAALGKHVASIIAWVLPQYAMHCYCWFCFISWIPGNLHSYFGVGIPSTRTSIFLHLR